MDFTLLRSLMTVLSFGTFVGIIVWAYARSNRAGFDEAAQLPFTEAPSSDQRAAARTGELS